MDANERNKIFQEAIAHAEPWIRDVEAAVPGLSAESAYRLLGVVLQSIRDRLPLSECADLASELPLILRGVFYEGWTPARLTRAEKRDFDGDLRVRIAALRLDRDLDAGAAARAVYSKIAARISAGEMRHAVNAMPETARRFLTGSGARAEAKSA